MMKSRFRLLITCLVVLLSLLLAGCTTPESETNTGTPNPTTVMGSGQSPVLPLVGTNTSVPDTQTTPESYALASDPGNASPPAKLETRSIFLPTLFKNGPSKPGEPAPVAQNVDLSPDNWQAWPVIPVISDRAIDIYRTGIAQGRDPAHFTKVGDCQNIRQYFLGLFDDETTYRLGENYQYLVETIDHFSGSWSRLSEAVRTGFNVASVLAPLQANPETCQPAETPLACEIRIWNPSFVIISMETWTSDRPVQAYEDYLRQIVEYAISQNVLPIVATKADNLEGDHDINQAVARVAADYDIPMWNFWAATNPLTTQGLEDDRFHLTNGPNYFDDPKSLDLGWPVRNLTGLLTVDAVWKAVR